VYICKETRQKGAKRIKKQKNIMKHISNISLEDIINCLYRIDNTITQDFTHIQEFLSPEFKEALEKEKNKFVNEENKRLHTCE
jgi:hypothetical protein